MSWLRKAPVKRFSERLGLHLEAPEITVRQDAPAELRGVVFSMACEFGLDQHELRAMACRVLRRREDPHNWSPANVAMEAEGLFDTCEWHEFYDLVEAVHQALDRKSTGAGSFDSDEAPSAAFERELNTYFVKRGIGWQLASGRIEVRGDEPFEDTVRQALDALQFMSHSTAARELHEAVRDLGRRPEPDITGAIQHALAGLECTMRRICEDPRPTMGQLLSKYPSVCPQPLRTALEKLWGFSSEQGRHLREGGQPSFAEAQLTVAISAAIVTYLVETHDRP